MVSCNKQFCHTLNINSKSSSRSGIHFILKVIYFLKSSTRWQWPSYMSSPFAILNVQPHQGKSNTSMDTTQLFLEYQNISTIKKNHFKCAILLPLQVKLFNCLNVWTHIYTAVTWVEEPGLHQNLNFNNSIYLCSYKLFISTLRKCKKTWHCLKR